MELQAGQPQRKGNKRGPAYAYNVKELRDREMDVARQAEHAYEHGRPLAAGAAGERARGRLNRRREIRRPGGACTPMPRSSPRGHPCQGRDTTIARRKACRSHPSRSASAAYSRDAPS